MDMSEDWCERRGGGGRGGDLRALYAVPEQLCGESL